MKLIKNDFEYEQALNELEALTGAPSNTAEGKRLKILSEIIEKYEEDLYFSSKDDE